MNPEMYRQPMEARSQTLPNPKDKMVEDHSREIGRVNSVIRLLEEKIAGLERSFKTANESLRQLNKNQALLEVRLDEKVDRNNGRQY